MNDDDLDGAEAFRALLSPGTPQELAGEQDVLAAFRAAQRGRAPRKGLRRFGAGSAGVVLFVAVGGGAAAAAFTGQLPDAVQSAVHSTLSGIGVPAPESERVASPPTSPVSTSRATTPRGSATTARPTQSPGPTAPSAVLPSLAPQPTRSPAPGIPLAPVTPTPGPVSKAVPAPTTAPPTTPAPAPPVLTFAVSAQQVPVHGSVTLTGTLRRDGVGLPDRYVLAQRRFPGQTEWVQVGRAVTGPKGAVAIVVEDLTRNAAYRLQVGAGSPTSAGRAVTVQPRLTLTRAVPAGAPAKRTISVKGDGALAGDRVQLLRRKADGSWVLVTATDLAAGQVATFTVAKAPAGASVRYRVQLLATGRHAAARAEITLVSPKA